MSDSQASRDELTRMVIVRVLMAVPVLFAVFFLPVGTLAY